MPLETKSGQTGGSGLFRFPGCLRSTTSIDANPTHRPMKLHGVSSSAPGLGVGAARPGRAICRAGTTIQAGGSWTAPSRGVRTAEAAESL